MTWVDAVILAVIVLSGVIGYMRGFIREVLGIGAWIGALVLAFLMLPGMRGIFINITPNQPWLADVAAIAVVFIATLIILKIIIAIIARGVRASVLGGVDRALGVLFGFARGAILVIIAYIAAGAFIPGTDRWPDPVRQARSLPYVADGAAWVVDKLPEGYRPRLPDPPTARAPTAEELLRPPARDRI
ncbi:CvpA family protein [Muricoccus radiodurans]|uniref:CvpA family protein n=1 Tax=Muricoccus radiodurans TaxID=2231721 RepID=UPI003CFB6D79